MFQDLAAGFAAVSSAAATVGAMVRVRVAEALGDRDVDALAAMRPCVPPTSRPLVDVVLENNEARTGLAKHVAEISGIGLADAQRRIQQLPAVIVEAVTAAHADNVATRLRAEHAIVTVRPSAVVET